MSERAAYSRVYWSVIDDLKFVSIYDDDHHLAAWLRLLLIADQAHPASAHLPSNVRRASVKALSDVGLIDVTAGRYRVHGLDAERNRRRDAATRLRTGRDPDGPQQGPNRDPERPYTPGRRLDETRQDEDRRDEPSAREGLPNLTSEAVHALEERTGRTWGQAGERQLSEYDELIEAHGLEAVCGAMDSLRDGKALTARQLVWGAMKLLEPMVDTRIVAKAEDAEQAERDSRKGIERTQAYLRELRGTA